MAFGWASPDYLLNNMSLDMIIMYRNYLYEIKTGEPIEFPDSPPRKQVEKFAGRTNYYRKKGGQK